MQDTIFKIGQTVIWNVGNMVMKGCVLEELENKVDVISHFRGNVRHVQKMSVDKSILKLL